MDINIAVSITKHAVQIIVNNEPLWIRLPADYSPTNVDDALVAATFFPAMTIGGDIKVTGEFHPSERVCAGNSELQKIFQGWLPSLRRTTLPGCSFGAPSSRPGVVSLFSAGVDSMHTLIERESEITHLLYIDGFEHAPGSTGNVEAIAQLQLLADRFGKELVVVETNALEFYRTFFVAREVYLASLYAAVAHLLGFEKLLAPSSETYSAQEPHGSTPWTDSMWGSEAMMIEHHGGASNRLEKTRRIAEHQFARHFLLVCHHKSAANCGVCEKCVRTIAALRVLGKRSDAFPHINFHWSLATTRFKVSRLSTFYEEIIDEALRQGDFMTVRAAGFAVARQKLRQGLRGMAWHLDRVVLGGRLGRKRVPKAKRWHALF